MSIEKTILILIFSFLTKQNILCQTDTSIENRDFTIIERYNTGKVKFVGQFGEDCLGNKHQKHGRFILFNKHGRRTSEKIYFYNKRRNKKILGLKHGWWGFGYETKYFLGSKRYSRIMDPCF